ncbi:MAG TPA: PAS domain-containing protein, partial [Candidatus Binatia bacterium]|nr:PAS domain-containing protein [Candidatus Binatia bacterium]
MGWNKIKKTQSAGRTRVASLFGLLLAAVLAFCSALLALRASPDTIQTRPDLTGLRPYPSRVAAAGCPLLLLVVFSWLTWYLLREIQALRRKQTELARLALVASKTENAVFLTNAEGAIEWANEGFARMSGHLPGDVLGKQCGALLLGTLQNINVTQKIRDGLTSQKNFTVEMHCSHRRGHRYWLSLNMTPVFAEQNQLVGFIGVGSDITGRRRAEEEVARIGRRSELLLNAAGDGIFGVDLQGAITFVNTAAAGLTGWPAGGLIGKPVSTILHQLRVHRSPAAQDELFTGAAFIDGTVQIGDLDEFKAKDGTRFPVEYTSTPVHESNNLIGSVVV